MVACAMLPDSSMRLQSGMDAKTERYIRAVVKRSFGATSAFRNRSGAPELDQAAL